jgi:hypothetical protein
LSTISALLLRRHRLTRPRRRQGQARSLLVLPYADDSVNPTARISAVKYPQQVIHSSSSFFNCLAALALATVLAITCSYMFLIVFVKLAFIVVVMVMMECKETFEIFTFLLLPVATAQLQVGQTPGFCVLLTAVSSPTFMDHGPWNP